MKCLSIRAPWARAIIHLGKDVENRSWSTKFRGRFLIHASATKDHEAYNRACSTAIRAGLGEDSLPAERALRYGGIIGSVVLTDCGLFTSSPWWIGPVGFKLCDPKPLAFIPYKARLGFFEMPYEIEASIMAHGAA